MRDLHEFTKERARQIALITDDMFRALSPAKQKIWLAAYNEINAFITAASEVAPNRTEPNQKE